jgi:tetratricopeptide (TPR) repeat protein
LDLSRARLAHRLKLARLGPEETAAMLEALFAEAITPDFMDGVYRETEGNPFFTEEVCKALVESGKLYFEDGVWHSPSMDELEIPQSIRSTVQSRVARLSSSSQKALGWAAFLGREFDFEPLLAVSDMDEEALLDALDEAFEAQLIEETQASKGDSFSFVHALIPTTLRDGLSGLRRVRTHKKVAAVLEALHPNDYDSLAYHYGEAGDERQALFYLTQAAGHAQRVYANEDAVRYYTEALDFIPEDHPERFELLAGRARVFDLLGRRDEELVDIEEMQALADRQGDQSLQVDALIALTDYYLASEAFGALPRTRKLAERADHIAGQLGDPVRRARTLRRVGLVVSHRLPEQFGREWFEEAVALFKDNGYPDEAADCLNDLRAISDRTGDYQEAQRLSEEALALSREAGDRRRESTSLRSLAYAYRNQNQPDQALPLAEAALELNQGMGDIAEEISTLQALGLILFDLGKQESFSYLHQSLEMAETFGFDSIGWNVALDVLDLDFRRGGKYQSGQAFLDERLALVENAEERPLNKTLFVSFNYHKMELFEYMGMYAEALRIVNKYLPVAREIELQPSRSQSWLDRLQAELGQPDIALRSLEAGLKLEPSNFHILFNAAFVAWHSGQPENWPAGLERVQAAVEILRGLGTDFFNNLAFALDMAARLCLALEQPREALEYAQEAIQLLPAAPEIYGREQFYYTYSQALRATGGTQEADKALKRAYKGVMQIAEQTEDERMRQSWLENVRYNREIIDMAKESDDTGWTG